jgi:hypothetical protein
MSGTVCRVLSKIVRAYQNQSVKDKNDGIYIIKEDFYCSMYTKKVKE